MLKNIVLIVSSLLFSLLFYQKYVGLNFLLFSILALALLSFFNFDKFKNKKIILYSFLYLGASVCVFLYNSTLSILTSVIAFFVLLGSISETKSSLYIELINGFYSTIASSFFHYFSKLQEETEAVKKRKINYLYWFKMIGIPLIVLVVFIILYRSANPYFNEIISSIDLSFINLQWIVFTCLAYFLLLNISKPLTIEPATNLDLEIKNELDRDNLEKQPKNNIIQENQLGIILLLVLNLLIAFFLTTDVFYLSSLTDLKASSLSQAVHEGIYALITSIVFAIIIILYFFRGNLNFYEKNKHLKILTTIWISLNIVLVLITAYKNYLYVTHHGFTYKRIGVFIYLCLSLIGLITTHIKVYAQYNLWYLLRKNISIAFLIFVCSSALNWDKLITTYNIEFAKTVDLNYLINLSDNNSFLLKEYLDKNSNKPTFEQERRIITKQQDYITYLKSNTWQEFIYDNLKISE